MLLVCPSVYLCISMCVAAAAVGYVRAISRISQYITEVAALGIILSALVAAASLCWMLLLLLLRYREGEIRARDPQRIVHAVLIGIHCRVSDLRPRLPTQCRPDLPRYLGAAASSLAAPS